MGACSAPDIITPAPRNKSLPAHPDPAVQIDDVAEAPEAGPGRRRARRRPRGRSRPCRRCGPIAPPVRVLRTKSGRLHWPRRAVPCRIPAPGAQASTAQATATPARPNWRAIFGTGPPIVVTTGDHRASRASSVSTSVRSPRCATTGRRADPGAPDPGPGESLVQSGEEPSHRILAHLSHDRRDRDVGPDRIGFPIGICVRTVLRREGLQRRLVRECRVARLLGRGEGILRILDLGRTRDLLARDLDRGAEQRRDHGQ